MVDFKHFFQNDLSLNMLQNFAITAKLLMIGKTIKTQNISKEIIKAVLFAIE